MTLIWMRIGIPSTGVGIQYLLRDDFLDTRSAGSVNGTPATPGPGTREVTDTGAGISVSSGNLVISGHISYATDPRLFYTEAVTRIAGRLLVAHFNIAAGGAVRVGFGADKNDGSFEAGILLYDPVPYLYDVNQGTVTSIRSITNADSIDYYLAIVLRSTGHFCFVKGGEFTNWTLWWIRSNFSDATMYAGYSTHNVTPVRNSSFIRVPQDLWLPVPLASDSFNRSNGALGITDGAGHAEANGGGSKVWTGATFTISSNKAINTPSVGAELLSDPGMEGTYVGGVAPDWTLLNGVGTEENVVVHGGSKAQKVVWSSATCDLFVSSSSDDDWYKFTLWLRNDGPGTVTVEVWNAVAFYIVPTNGAYQQFTVTGIRGNSRPSFRTSAACTYYVDDVSFKQITYDELFASLQAGSKDVIVDVDLTVPAGLQAGIVLRLDNATSPANFMYAFLSHGNSQQRVILRKVVAGVDSSVINATVTYNPGATLRLIVSGTSVSVFYNGAQVGTTQTVSDAGIVNNTLHGLFSTDAANTLENFRCWAVGTGNEYSKLNSYIA